MCLNWVIDECELEIELVNDDASAEAEQETTSDEGSVASFPDEAAPQQTIKGPAKK